MPVEPVLHAPVPLRPLREPELLLKGHNNERVDESPASASLGTVGKAGCARKYDDETVELAELHWVRELSAWHARKQIAQQQ